MRRVILLAALLVGCKSPPAPSSFGINVTVDASSLSSQARSEITAASLAVSGDETYSRTFDIRSAIASGQVRFRYIPGITSGNITLSLAALSSDGTVVARAPDTAVAIESGKAVSATLVLSGSSTDDMGSASDDGGDGGCDPGFHACSGTCVDDRSVDNCGSSCSACPVTANASMATCDGTTCGLQCNSGFHVCSGVCVSSTSANSCNMSCTPCSAPFGGSATCDGTSCGGACPSGQKLCFGACIGENQACNGSCPGGTHECNGNCFDDTSVNSCGTSCIPCAVPANATMATCSGGQCGFQCNNGYKVCGSGCIPNSACCSSADCTQPANGVATCDTGTNTCVIACNSTYTKCGMQCIPSTACCTNSDCPQPTNGMGTCMANHTCTATCNPPYTAVCSNVCVDTNNDNANCGGCGKTCSGQCALGRCQVVVAANQVNPAALAVDATNVYWDASGDNTNGAIMKAAVAGGTPVPLASNQPYSTYVAVDSTNVYWATGGQFPYTHNISKVAISGGTPTMLLPAGGSGPGSEGYMNGFAADSSSVYWIVFNDSSNNFPAKIRSVPNGGGTAATLATGPNKDEFWGTLQLDSSNIFFVDVTAKSVMTVAKTGGTPAPLGSGYTFPYTIAIDGSSVYLMDGSAAPFSLVKFPKTGGSATPLATGIAAYPKMAVDGANVYYNDGAAGGKLWKVSVNGGTPVLLANLTDYVGQIAIDSTSVYWIYTGTTGSVMKLTPK